MTRARKRLILTWARYRRRFGAGEQERTTPSWFLSEVPAELIADMGPRDEPEEVALPAERFDVRQAARRSTFTGRTFNSVENVADFFGQRGTGGTPPRPNPNKTAPQPPPAPFARPPVPQPAPPPPARKVNRAGMTVEHPKYGTGTVVRREGDGDSAKITVNFPRFGLKKLVEKYAGLKKS
jgi:DNA helicase-2/ATP-dependent DNA helicase PcrA